LLISYIPSLLITTFSYSKQLLIYQWYTASPDIALRKAIITQAIIDATNISEFPAAKKFEQEAKSWIFGGSESFKSTCIEGGIEPAFVVKVTKAIIKLHN
jgi:hypothetical protein